MTTERISAITVVQVSDEGICISNIKGMVWLTPEEVVVLIRFLSSVQWEVSDG